MRNALRDVVSSLRPTCTPRERRAETRARRALPRPWRLATGIVALLSLSSSVVTAERIDARAPMTCTRGPSNQSFAAVLTAPLSTPPGSVYTVRIDSLPSGRVSHFGLNHLFDMRTDYSVDGALVVAGTVRLVPGSGTPNVREGARAWLDATGIHLLLPGHVENDDQFTPPSIAFEVMTGGAAGVVRVRFVHYEVRANVFLLGDIRTSCDPTQGPAVIATTRVEAAREGR